MGSGEDQVAFVTGAASGMGRGAVVAMAAAGYRVCAVDIDANGLAALQETTPCIAVVADVTDRDQVHASVDRCTAELGAVDLAFVNAGIPSHMTLATIDPATYRRVTGVNIDGVVFALEAVRRSMTERADGRVGGTMVVTASTGGLRPFGGDPFYAMTKWAAVGFVRSVAPALAEEGIAIHGLCPGLTDTAFLGPLRERLVQLGAPMLTPADVASAVLHLAAAPLESAGTVWLLEDPSSPGPQPYHFHDLEPNETSANISALLRGG